MIQIMLNLCCLYSNIVYVFRKVVLKGQTDRPKSSQRSPFFWKSTTGDKRDLSSEYIHYMIFDKDITLKVPVFIHDILPCVTKILKHSIEECLLTSTTCTKTNWLDYIILSHRNVYHDIMVTALKWTGLSSSLGLVRNNCTQTHTAIK